MAARGPYWWHGLQFKIQIWSDVRIGTLGRREAFKSRNLSAHLMQMWLGEFDCGSVGQVARVACVNQSICTPMPVVSRLDDHAEKIRSTLSRCCVDLIQIIRQAPGIQGPVVIICDDDKEDVRNIRRLPSLDS